MATILNPLTGESVEIGAPGQPMPTPGLAERRAARIAEKVAVHTRIAERIAQPPEPVQSAQEK